MQSIIHWSAFCAQYIDLTHSDQGKTAAILQTIFSDHSPCMEIVIF